jgi:hypothetical protein
MAFAALQDMSYSDDELYDRQSPEWEPPMHPPGLMFSLAATDLEQAGCDGGDPGDSCRFSAMGEVTSIFKGTKDCRIEIELQQFAGEDGKFFDLSEPASICLCGPELEKMELEADCERGDLIHLIGEARLESQSSTEFGGDRCTLQITHLAAVEDESTESREG